jgi:hypothetical protein
MRRQTSFSISLAMACIGASVAAPLAARAEAFLGASALASEWPSDTCAYSGCDRRGTGWSARAGWMFTPWIGMEVRGFDLGKSRNGTPDLALANDPLNFPLGGEESRAKGTGIGVVAAWPVSSEVTLSAIAGIARTEATVWHSETFASGSGGSVTSNQYLVGRGNEPYYGIGMDYYLVPAVALSAEFQRTHLPVGDPVNSVSLGVTLRWR